MKKAFILGAGLGTRLRPLTDRTPKPLVPVFNRPMVEFALDACIDAGIEQFAINTHHCPEVWGEAFPSGTYRGCPIDFFHEPVLLETGGGLKNIAAWIGDEPLLVHNGDILSSIDLAALIAEHQAGSHLATLALRSEGPACVAEFDAETRQVHDLRNLLGRGDGTHQFTGIYALQPELLDLIASDEVISVRPALVKAASMNQLGGICLDRGDWVDLGTIETYMDAHFDSNQQERIHPSATIARSARLSPSCWIGAGATIGENCQLIDCVVWPRATVPPDTQAKGRVFQTD